MKTADHLYIGKYLSKEYLLCENSLFAKAFVFGNILPDINFFTYLKGIKSGEKLKGHNYKTAKENINRLSEKMTLKQEYNIFDYIRFGKLIHYTADSFTYPHNGGFKGNLKKHIEYEEKLHKEFFETLFSFRNTSHRICVNKKEFPKEFAVLHAKYEKECGSAGWDLIYIFTAVISAANAFALPEKQIENMTLRETVL